MTKGVNVREIALDCLLLITRDGMFSHLVLQDALAKHQYLEKQERSFLSRLVRGTVERMTEMDYVINRYSTVKASKMKPVIRCILRMGVYQLLYMDSVPDSAVCNESVKLAQKRKFQNLKGFVNGVLRNIAREKENIPYPKKETDLKKYLEVKYSMPEWILDLWMEEYDEKTLEGMLSSFFTEGATCIRVNPEKTSPDELMKQLEQQGIRVERHPEEAGALYISGYDYLNRIPEFTEGQFYIQDVSSMQIGKVAAPEKGSLCIDVCAAPGGKALHLSEMMQGTGKIYARDITEKKVALIRENIERMGALNIEAQVQDATVLDETMVEKADVVLADLPCSGLGIIGKKPDVKYRLSMEEITRIIDLQQEILDTVCQYVKKDGVLVYSTCTINRMENQNNVQWFLNKHREFQLETEKQILPDGGHNDGFFYARLKKKGF